MLDLKSDYKQAYPIDLMDLKRLDPINKGIKEMKERGNRDDFAPEAVALQEGLGG